MFRFSSPSFILSFVSKIIEIEGQSAVQYGSKFRGERELFIGAKFALGLTSHTGKFYWVRKPEEDPPDVELGFLEATPQGNILDFQEIEIVEFQKYSVDTIYNQILKKIKNNSYPQQYILLCYVHGIRVQVDFKYLSLRLNSLRPKLKAVYIMFDTDNKRNICMALLYPKFIRVDYNFIKVANTWPQNLSHVTKMVRGK